MADTTIPGATPPAQDLQINLEELTPKTENIQTKEINSELGTQNSELNLDLDLNLPEVAKNDDRLQEEDKKNKIFNEPVVEKVVEATPVVEAKPVAETVAETKIESTPVVKEITTPITEPTTKIEEIKVPDTNEENLPEINSLENDKKIIEELQGHESAGGLAPEATITPQPAPVMEAPKTFDLDAMLGTTPTTTPTTIATESPLDKGGSEGGFETPTTPVQIEQPQPAPVVSAVMQTAIPHNAKTTGVKSLLFVVLFAALGFTTFFILKTMYPIEFSNIFGGSEDVQLHASADITGSIEEITGTIEEITGEVINEMTEMSGEIIEDETFGELNDLETITPEPEQTDLSRLTDYLNQGNDFLEQGKTMNNNTIIKYGLYISKKATSFLEKIANGEEINNLSGYFAQFDQYIAQLELLVNTTSTQPATTTAIEEPVSVTPPQTNETPETVTPVTETTPTQTNPNLAE